MITKQKRLPDLRSWFCAATVAALSLGCLPSACSGDENTSIEEKTRIHRLSTTKRAPYDAFVYVNRIPESPTENERADAYAGRVFGRLANQEGRILLKLPTGMDRDSYVAFKKFFRYDADSRGGVGNCVACHTPVEFTDFKNHVVAKDGLPQPTPSLRNLNSGDAELGKALLEKIAAGKLKRSGTADEIDDAYSKITITEADVPGLVKFLNLLNDVSDEEFRQLILNATVLDTSEDIE